MEVSSQFPPLKSGSAVSFEAQRRLERARLAASQQPQSLLPQSSLRFGNLQTDVFQRTTAPQPAVQPAPARNPLMFGLASVSQAIQKLITVSNRQQP